MHKRHTLSVILLFTLFSALTVHAGDPRSSQVADCAPSCAQSELLTPLGGGPGMGTWPIEISVNRTKLNFGAIEGTTFTGPQTFFVSNAGGGTLDWTASISGTWLQASPTYGGDGTHITATVDPSGLSPGTYHGSITITGHDAINSPSVDTTLTVYGPGTDAPPFGGFSTPLEGSTVRGSIPVTGWVLDDTEVENVEIYYQQGTGDPQYLGDAAFVEGARPDITQLYPNYPNNYRAGWGYTLLTNLLPGGGNGTYTLHAIATDASSNQVTLGTKTITCDNANAVKPFGAIDTPTQGGIASGTISIKGWALTPQPNSIPTDGSTIDVWVDNVNLGHPTYNIYRADIASMFPGYVNSDGAGGLFPLDTTAYENGVHTVHWTATDDAGNTDGIGSRFFTINNPHDEYEPPTTPEIKLSRTRLNFRAQTRTAPPSGQSVLVSNSGSGNLEWTASPSASWLVVNTASGDSSSVSANSSRLSPGTYQGSSSASWLMIDTQSGNSGGSVSVSVNPSRLSPGTYQGSILVSDPNASDSPVTLFVNLDLCETGDSTSPFGSFDTPVSGSTVRGSIPVTGWVLDDTEVENVEIYYQQGTGDPQYLGDAAFVEGARPDITQLYPNYPNNYRAGWGYTLLTNLLPGGGNGTYTLHAIATDASSNQVTLGTKTITCDNANAVKPFGAIDTPTQGGIASGTSYVNWGWALTPQPNGIPTDGSTINMWVDGVDIGHPTYDIYRADIASMFPGYVNSDGAGGLFSLDTTAYENGVHTIHWSATDDAGNTDGIGSRFFTIQNPSTGHVSGDGAIAGDSTATTFTAIQEAIDNVAKGGTVYVATGTYTESVTLDKNLYVVLSGDVDLNGDLSISAGSFIASADNLSISGDLTHSAGAFDPNGGMVIFDGGGTQTIDGDTLFFNVTVGSGVELETTSNVALDGTLLNHGVTRETKAVVGTGTIAFGLADVTINVTTAGLTDLQVERRDQDHPNAPAKIQTGKYWSFTPTGSGFTLDMTLPHNEIPESSDEVCRYTGTDQVWDCAADSFHILNRTITRNGITQLSDWATWNDAPGGLVYLPLIRK